MPLILSIYNLEKRKNMKKILLNVCLIVSCLAMGTTTAQGQSLKDIVKSAVSHFKGVDLEGTWSYEGIAIELETDNLLKKAGGKAGTAQLEKKLNDQLYKLGFEPGSTTITFNADSTFTKETKGKATKGTYTFDSETSVLTLKYGNRIPVKSTLSQTGGQISLLFDVKGFMSLVSFIDSKSSRSTVKGITSLLKSYDGMMIGMELKKKK